MKSLEKTVVLVGLMGSGKSRVGVELAKLLKCPFADSDHEIELAAGMSVSDIFETYGEQEFRAGERKVLQRLLKGDPMVLASGGGAFIQDDVRKMIKDKAISVWLKADLETLVERTSRTDKRPLLKNGNPADKLRALMDVRYPIYAQADVTVESDDQTPKDMAKRIVSALRTYTS